MNNSTHDRGVAGEDKACAYLESNGYRIIERNFRTRGGEIDIICEKGEYIYFVEVKSLPHGNAEILASELGKLKQQKIIKTAKCYLQKNRQYSNRFVQFDVLAVDVPVLDPVYHISNAFSE